MKKVGIYIHIPFCRSKCIYCDFCSFTGLEKIYAPYKQALLNEIRAVPKEDLLVETIFIGGGTPTVLPPTYIEEILQALSDFHISKDGEITIEANPGTLNRDMLAALKRAGVNRLSIGLQSADNSMLKTLSRIHDFQMFKENFLEARAFGFRNINVDLMFALPGQSDAMWQDTINQVTALQPEHISAYALIAEENSKISQLYDEGALCPVDEETDRRMLALMQNILKEQGYIQYEISNFAKPGYVCRHNMAYWNRKDYIGLGLAAHSFLNSIRFENSEDLDLYLRHSSNPEMIRQNAVKIEEAAAMEEFMFLGLRLYRGVEEAAFEKSFGKDIDAVFKKPLADLATENLLWRQGGRIGLTDRGFDLANWVMAKFLIGNQNNT